MGNQAPRTRKPRVLRRKGKEIEEALLFEDHIDEAALEEWERKMGLKEETKDQKDKAHPPKVPEHEQKGQKEGARAEALAPQATSTSSEPSWRESGRLRWLGITAMRSYWEEQGPKARGLLLGMVASGIFALFGVGLFLHELFFGQPQRPNRVTITMPSREVILEVIVPIDGGRHGLLLGLALEVEDTFIRPWMLRSAIYDLLSNLELSQLKGPFGMETVRRRLDEGLTRLWPGLKPGRVRFLDYLVL